MTERFLRRALLAAPLVAPLAVPLVAPRLALAQPAPPRPRPGTSGTWRGMNLAHLPEFPLGMPDARLSMRQTAALGADSVALMPSAWQDGTTSAEVSLGSDMSAEQLRAGIEQAHLLGLRVLVKPQLWVQGGRTGDARPGNERDWRRWFTTYGAVLLALARVAQQTGAEAFSVGTGLNRSLARPEWRPLLAQLRGVYRGKLILVAESPEAAEATTLWEALDGIGLRLFPALGRDDAPEDWRPVMRREAERLDRLAAQWRKKLWVAELGLRSAAGAAARPWEAVEDRPSVPDPRVQAEVLARWLAVLDRPSVEAVLLWRWFTDPRRGGPQDSDFTLQGKLAEGVLLGAWAR